MNTEKQAFSTLSTRVKSEDLATYKEHCKGFEVQHEAFTALISKLNNSSDADLIALNISLDQVIELKKENKELQETIDIQNTELLKANLIKPSEPLKDTQCIIEFTAPLSDKLTALRRFLKAEKKIPQESSKQEFEEKFISQAIEYYIKYNYDFLNR